MNTFRQLGYALAIPILATLAAAQGRRVLAGSGLFPDPGAAAKDLTGGAYPDLLAAAGSRPAVAAALRGAYAAGLDRIFLISGLVALVAGAAVLALVRPPHRAEPPADAPPVDASPVDASPADAVAATGRRG